MDHVFDLDPRPSLPIQGRNTHFPINRIFCVGRNYEAHAREMDLPPKHDTPIYFTKSAAAACQSGKTIPYPPRTENCHHEIELVVAIGKAGWRVDADTAMDHVYGYACGIDLTRRDLQNIARNEGNPWDIGKDFENAAILGTVVPAQAFGPLGAQRISLMLNGKVRQDARIDQLIWSVPELIADLSTLYHLAPGDLIYTGTPAGVGPIAPGDSLVGRIDGLPDLTLGIGPAV